MSDGSVIFKSAAVAAPVATDAPSAKPKTDSTIASAMASQDSPLSEYALDKSKPYVADYYDLGDHWGEFEEIPQIDAYLKSLIASGKMENSVKAAQVKLKQIEKVVNSDPSERKVIKLAKIAAYVKFLNESSSIERNAYKYGKY